MDRRAFIKRLAQYGWMAPVITTVISQQCNAGLSGYEAFDCKRDNARPRCVPQHQILDHKPLWEYWIKGGKRHDRRWRS